MTWGEFDRETQVFGLATTGGLVTTTGIAGYTLGGGLGWLMRKHGLACDNLLSVDLVTADGRFLTVSDEEHPELMWGLRGAGANFGVATSMEYRLHPTGPVLAGRLIYSFDQAREAFHLYREFTRTAPEELTANLGMRISPDGRPVVGISVCHSGEIHAGEELLEPLRRFGPPIADFVHPMAYTEVQRLSDPLFPAGLCQYWKSNFLRDLENDAIDTITAFFRSVPSPLTGVVVEQIGGAVGQVGPNDTDFCHREAPYDLLIPSLWTGPADSTRNLQWTREFWQAMQPFSTGGTYVNYLDIDRSASAAYDASKYERLAALKKRYDPTNFFRSNVNIQPEGPNAA